MNARRRARLLSATLGLAIAAAPLAASPAVAVTLVQDPDRNSTSIATWSWQSGKTASSINTYIGANGVRPIDIEVDGPTSLVPTFSVAYVQNSGSYARTQWWYPDLSSSEVAAKLSAHNARLIDLEPYVNGSGNLRYAAIMVLNVGAAQKTWWWYTGQTSASIASKAASLGARPIDIDRYVSSGVTRFSVVFIKNTGVDAKGWAHLYGQSLSSINTYAQANNVRLLQLERVPGATTYDAVLQSLGSGERNVWSASGMSSTGITNAASQLGARVFKIEPYTIGGTKYFAALLINNANAETSRIRDIVAGVMTGSWGFYLKKVGGSDALALQPDRVFEPASMLKIVHAVRALREIQGSGGTITTNTLIPWYVNPSAPTRYPGDSADYKDDKNICAYESDGDLIPLIRYTDKYGPVIIKQMLEQSDNRTTDAITRRFGFASLNGLIDLAGMTKSHLYHRIGCPRLSSPQPYLPNQLTLRDAGRIYEKVENGTLLDGTRRNVLYGYLLGGAVTAEDDLGEIVTDALQALNVKTSLRPVFFANFITRSKGGSYDFCTSTNCDVIRTVGGIAWVPFYGTSGVIRTPYVYGRFYNTNVNCTLTQVRNAMCGPLTPISTGMRTISLQMWVQVIRAAAATWPKN